MLGRDAPRHGIAAVFAPVGRLLVRLHVPPDAITWGGTIVSCLLALGLLVPGRFALGAVLLAVVLLLDSLDGVVARLGGNTSRWGAFLDSTLDRISDGVVLGALAVHLLVLAPRAAAPVTAGILAVAAIILSFTVSYAKARAEAVGVDADVGLLERADRYVVILMGTFVAAFIGAWALVAALGLLCVGSAWTIAQRMHAVRRASRRTGPGRPRTMAEPAPRGRIR